MRMGPCVVVVLLVSPAADAADPTRLNTADATLLGEETYDRAGASVSGAGDVNGDGKADVLVGAPGWAPLFTKPGTAYLLSGPVTGRIDLSAADAKFVGQSDDE